MAKDNPKVYSTGDDKLWNDLARLEKKFGIKNDSESEKEKENQRLRDYVNKGE